MDVRRSMDSLTTPKRLRSERTCIYSVKERWNSKIVFSLNSMKEEEMDALIKAMDGQAGDLLLFAADKDKVVAIVCSNLRLHIAKQCDMIDKSQYKFLWVTEFPLLGWSDEQNRYTAMHHHLRCHLKKILNSLMKTRRCPCESIRYRIKWYRTWWWINPYPSG